jgi:hypothetical protein
VSKALPQKLFLSHNQVDFSLFSESSGEEIILTWKRGIAVLTASTVKVTMNPRIRLMPSPTHSETVGSTQTGYNLEIRDVRKTDAGEYACQMGTVRAIKSLF